MAGSTCGANFTIQFAATVVCQVGVEPDDNPKTVSGYEKKDLTVNFFYTIGTADAGDIAHANSKFTMFNADGTGVWPAGVVISDITFQHNKPKAAAPASAAAPLTAVNAEANWVRFSVVIARSRTEDFSFDARIQLHIENVP